MEIENNKNILQNKRQLMVGLDSSAKISQLKTIEKKINAIKWKMGGRK